MWIWCLFCKSAEIIHAQQSEMEAAGGKNVNYLVNARDVACRYLLFLEEEIKMFFRSPYKKSFARRLTDATGMKFLIFYPHFRFAGAFYSRCWTLPEPNHQLRFILVHYSNEAGGINLFWIAYVARQKFAFYPFNTSSHRVMPYWMRLQNSFIFKAQCFSASARNEDIKANGST